MKYGIRTGNTHLDKLHLLVHARNEYLQIEKTYGKTTTFETVSYYDPNYSYEEILAILNILSNQIKATRKLSFPYEHRKIWIYCMKCKCKKFYIRTGIQFFHFSNYETEISPFYACESCKLIEYEKILIENKKEDKDYSVGGFIPKGYLDDILDAFTVLHYEYYYKWIKIQFEEFFIEINQKLLCPICKKVFSKTNAIKHYNAIFITKTHPCLKYYERNELCPH